jgi:hypothetical protein
MSSSGSTPVLVPKVQIVRGTETDNSIDSCWPLRRQTRVPGSARVEVVSGNEPASFDAAACSALAMDLGTTTRARSACQAPGRGQCPGFRLFALPDGGESGFELVGANAVDFYIFFVLHGCSLRLVVDAQSWGSIVSGRSDQKTVTISSRLPLSFLLIHVTTRQSPIGRPPPARRA